MWFLWFCLGMVVTLLLILFKSIFWDNRKKKRFNYYLQTHDTNKAPKKSSGFFDSFDGGGFGGFD